MRHYLDPVRFQSRRSELNGRYCTVTEHVRICESDVRALSTPSLARFSSSALALPVLATLIAMSQPASAGPIANGPVIVAGYSGDENGADEASQLAIASAGWRWRFDGADCLDNFLAKGRIDFSWAVEPLIGGVFGDSDAFETSLVPYARLAPLGWENVVPWFEAGIGVAYTTLSNYGLGSSVQFSDNAGIGITFGGKHRWSVGYRFRHLSHAGLFDDRNDGLNAHFVTLSVE